MKGISPKVYIPTALAILAGIALYLITGEKEALVITLTGLATGGLGAAAPPARGAVPVSQRLVQILADGKHKLVPVTKAKAKPRFDAGRR